MKNFKKLGKRNKRCFKSTLKNLIKRDKERDNMLG